jgi:hypothetical protein
MLIPFNQTSFERAIISKLTTQPPLNPFPPPLPPRPKPASAVSSNAGLKEELLRFTRRHFIATPYASNSSKKQFSGQLLKLFASAKKLVSQHRGSNESEEWDSKQIDENPDRVPQAFTNSNNTSNEWEQVDQHSNSKPKLVGTRGRHQFTRNPETGRFEPVEATKFACWNPNRRTCPRKPQRRRLGARPDLKSYLSAKQKLYTIDEVSESSVNMGREDAVEPTTSSLVGRDESSTQSSDAEAFKFPKRVPPVLGPNVSLLARSKPVDDDSKASCSCSDSLCSECSSASGCSSASSLSEKGHLSRESSEPSFRCTGEQQAAEETPDDSEEDEAADMSTTASYSSSHKEEGRSGSNTPDLTRSDSTGLGSSEIDSTPTSWSIDALEAAKQFKPEQVSHGHSKAGDDSKEVAEGKRRSLDKYRMPGAYEAFLDWDEDARVW